MKSGQTRDIGFVAVALFLREVIRCQTEISFHDPRRGLLLTAVLISRELFLLTEFRKRTFVVILRGGM